MFVITAIVGNSFKNERSLSSASATISSPRPSRALLPNALRRPPMTAVGSSPARSSTSATIDVVVVLPCAPAIAIPSRSRMPVFDPYTHASQPLRDVRSLRVGSAHLVPEIGQQFGNPAHADAADPH